MKENYNLHIGDVLYEEYYTSEGRKYREVKIVDIYLESYINGWKTIIKTEHNNITFNHFASDLGKGILTENQKKIIERMKNNG